MAEEFRWKSRRRRVWRRNNFARDGTLYNAVDCFQLAEQPDRAFMRFRKLPVLLVSLGLATVATLRAQEPLKPLNPLVPLLPEGAVEAMSRGEVADLLASAQRAQELGLSSPAAGLYRQLLKVAPADRGELTLALATVLLDAGQAAEAEQALAGDTGPHGAAWHLRAGLAAAQLKKLETARSESAAIRPEELAKADLGWYWFLQGMLLELVPGQDLNRASDFYNRAENSAVTDLQRVRFVIARRRVMIQRIRPSKAEILNWENRYKDNQGTANGYDFARVYAGMLAMDERPSEAVEFLQRVLLTLPVAERGWWDEFRFLIGFIGDRTRTDATGRRYLFQLLENGSDANWQRVGLQLLADASRTDATRAQFSDELDKLIAVKPAHKILESLLLFRAQVALDKKEYSQARDVAEKLLREFPGSPLRVHAYAVQARAAWDTQSYRVAAASAGKAHDELAASTEGELVAARGWLSVLRAEAYFRAGITGDGDAIDYRNAADAYETALKERPAGVKAGDLMFQRVIAEIRAGALDKAQPLLDALADDPASEFGLENRWQAEWILARALQVQGKAEEAFGRVNRLLAEKREGAGAVTGLPAELRARMAWLQARLAFDTRHPDQALALVDKLPEVTTSLEPVLKSDILSTGALLKAEAEFALGGEGGDAKVALQHETTALEILRKLRSDFPKSDAAASSYLVEAKYFADPGRDRIADARTSLGKLADEFPNSPSAPIARFRAALLAERLGQEEGYKQANDLLVGLVKDYPQSDLVFDAKLREGGLKMKLNDYAGAQQVFQDLVNKFSQHSDVTRAQLELAICIDSQSMNNPALVEVAKTKFADLRERVDAPYEVRAEAGYHLGEIFVRRGDLDQAAVVWWRDVVVEFLEKKGIEELGPKGCQWVARALIRSGDIYQQQGKLEEAKNAWRYVLKKQLPSGGIVAKAKLKDVGASEAMP